MVHGGDRYRNKVAMDFSVNVNPLGMPEGVKMALHKAIAFCTRYPDSEAEQLGEVVSKMISVDRNHLLFGNGASELFMAVVHALKPQKVIIPVPSFYGYEYAAKASQGEILYYPMKEENAFALDEEILSILDESADLLFLANPNNPTGNGTDENLLIQIIQTCAEKNIYVILDECFIEFCEKSASMLTRIEQFPNLLLVRAFTKIFAVPGVRLGYLVSGNKGILSEIKKQLPEWNLSIFAQMAGIACAKERDFITKTVEYCKKEGGFLGEALEKLGFQVFPHISNFIMVYARIELYEKLLEKEILIRDCSNFRGLSKGYYRIAVKNRQENEKLLDIIGEII